MLTPELKSQMYEELIQTAEVDSLVSDLYEGIPNITDVGRMKLMDFFIWSINRNEN